MNKFKNYIKVIRNSSWKQRKQTLRILLLYFRFYCLLEMFPLHFYYKRYLEPSSKEQSYDLQLYFKEICLIHTIGRHLPWNNKCIVESLVIKKYLERYGLRIPIHLGVSIETGFSAHAWCLFNHVLGFNKINHSR